MNGMWRNGIQWLNSDDDEWLVQKRSLWISSITKKRKKERKVFIHLQYCKMWKKYGIHFRQFFLSFDRNCIALCSVGIAYDENKSAKTTLQFICQWDIIGIGPVYLMKFIIMVWFMQSIRNIVLYSINCNPLHWISLINGFWWLCFSLVHLLRFKGICSFWLDNRLYEISSIIGKLFYTLNQAPYTRNIQGNWNKNKANRFDTKLCMEKWNRTQICNSFIRANGSKKISIFFIKQNKVL